MFTPLLCFSQSSSDSLVTEYDSHFDIVLGGSVEFATPQKYGAAVNLTFGKNVKKIFLQQNVASRTLHNIKGINLEAGIFRGGYRAGLYFINVGSSMIGTAGTRIGMVYLKNNSFTNVLKSRDLIGIEAEIYAFYKIKVGVLKDLNDNKYIPSLGFGIGIGPTLYD